MTELELASSRQAEVRDANYMPIWRGASGLDDVVRARRYVAFDPRTAHGYPRAGFRREPELSGSVANVSLQRSRTRPLHDLVAVGGHGAPAAGVLIPRKAIRRTGELPPIAGVSRWCSMASGPKFIRFFWPIVGALRDFGGSAQPREVTDRVIEMVDIGDDERAERTKGGALRVDNQVHWARNYLVWAGLLDGSQRGRWTLTQAGWALPLGDQDHAAAYALFKKVREERREEWGQTEPEADDEDTEEPPTPLSPSDSEQTSLVDSLRQVVLGLSPSGFEGLCKRLLTELGLVQLRTVGRSGDRGIDVEGHLRVSSVISFRVGVQCKLYADGNKVTPRQIRELQGALGPYDRGIFMTTSVFTQQAEEQASSPGYKPIDLIDGERLLELLQEHQLGVEQVTVVDRDFFAPFSSG